MKIRQTAGHSGAESKGGSALAISSGPINSVCNIRDSSGIAVKDAKSSRPDAVAVVASGGPSEDCLLRAGASQRYIARCGAAAVGSENSLRHGVGAGVQINGLTFSRARLQGRDDLRCSYILGISRRLSRRAERLANCRTRGNGARSCTRPIHRTSWREQARPCLAFSLTWDAEHNE